MGRMKDFAIELAETNSVELFNAYRTARNMSVDGQDLPPLSLAIRQMADPHSIIRERMAQRDALLALLERYVEADSRNDMVDDLTKSARAAIALCEPVSA